MYGVNIRVLTECGQWRQLGYQDLVLGTSYGGIEDDSEVKYFLLNFPRNGHYEALVRPRDVTGSTPLSKLLLGLPAVGPESRDRVFGNDDPIVPDGKGASDGLRGGGVVAGAVGGTAGVARVDSERVCAFCRKAEPKTLHPCRADGCTVVFHHMCAVQAVPVEMQTSLDGSYFCSQHQDCGQRDPDSGDDSDVELPLPDKQAPLASLPVGSSRAAVGDNASVLGSPLADQPPGLSLASLEKPASDLEESPVSSGSDSDGSDTSGSLTDDPDGSSASDVDGAEPASGSDVSGSEGAGSGSGPATGDGVVRRLEDTYDKLVAAGNGLQTNGALPRALKQLTSSLKQSVSVPVGSSRRGTQPGGALAGVGSRDAAFGRLASVHSSKIPQLSVPVAPRRGTAGAKPSS